MIRRHALAVLVVACALALAGCSSGSSPAQPAPVPTPTPVPTPAPTPPPALSVIPPCPLPPSNPGALANCTDDRSQLRDDVNAAIDLVITERPDLFDLNDVDGGPRILDLNRYMTAVVAAIGHGGLCGRVDAEGEIGVKLDNSFNEQWSIASRAGWNPPAGNWVRRKYVGVCSPAVF
ncbi:MAG TPA: hypothetical protein VL691_16175 [Vicinamibacteria bacterium]|nr:hypothetical protein [Vicinamibacteria bacterium]